MKLERANTDIGFVCPN